MRNKLIATFCLFLFWIVAVNGQKQVNSPYARFNLGILEPAGSFKSLGMGGVGVAFRDNKTIFVSNPASYSSLDTNSFIFDFGIDYSMNLLTDGESKYSSDDVNFDHFLIGFPLVKGIGFAAGILPLSNGYYRMSSTVTKNDPAYDPIAGEFTVLHEGDGGLTNFFLGTGINVTKNLSAGINMSVLFGQITRNNKFVFADYESALNNNSSEKLRVSGLNFDFGLQYFIPLKNDFFINTGLSVTSSKKYKSTWENYSYLYSVYSTVDTLSYTSSSDYRTSMPFIYKGGISFGQKNKFVVGADYITAKWSKGIIPGYEGYLADSRSFLFGVEYIPDKYSNFNMAKRFEYRLGFHAGNSYLLIDEEKIKELGFSAGLGLPMRRTLSRTNLFVDFTKRGSTKAANQHAENYITFGISLNLYDFWFIQRKYD